MNKSFITLELEGVTEEQVHRYREIIHILISTGSLDLFAKEAIISFDPGGNIGKIEVRGTKYVRRNKPLT